MSPRTASHTPVPDTSGICKVCGWECTSPQPDPETPAPEPGDQVGEEFLVAAHPGTRVYDADGDVWTKGTDGKWHYYAASLDSADFAYIFQPKLAED